MVLELNRLYEIKSEEKKLTDQMKCEVNDWLVLNELNDVYSISKLNGFYVVLEGVNVALSEELLNDFELIFGVVCESICEYKVRNMFDGGSFVKYSYYFHQSGGIY